MKLLQIGFLLSSILWAQASDIDERRHIEVSGTAKILVEPDMAKWTVRMRGEAASIDEASDQLKASVDGLLTSLKEAGFSAEMLRFSAISSGRHYEGQGIKRVFKGFYAERTGVLKLKDLDKRQALEKVLLKDDKINVSGMTAESTKHDEWKRKALLQAAVVAKEKASDLAQTLGSEIAVVLSITEQQSNGFSNHNMISNRMISDAAGSVSLDKITYDSKVFVKFALK